MAVLMIVAALLYTLRNSALSRSAHVGIVVGASLFTGCMLGLALFYSSHSTLLTLDTVDNETRQFMVLWSRAINIILIVLWVVTLITLLAITRVRNLFWVGGNFYVSVISSLCSCYC